MEPSSLSRIDKLQVDRLGITPERARAARSACSVVIACGPEIATSRTALAATLTALRTAQRCFPGSVLVHVAPSTLALLQDDAYRLELAHAPQFDDASMSNADTNVIAIGTTSAPPSAVQVSFDGWIAQVMRGPRNRLAEGDECALAGVVAGAMAVSEVFLHRIVGIPEATRRPVRLSLWNPCDGEPLRGPALHALPKRAWLAGLGHLGQGHAWAWSWLPFAEPGESELWLLDHDTVEPPNLETGLLSKQRDLGKLKTRVVGPWLESRGFRTRWVERELLTEFVLQHREPRLILGGFDNNLARRLLATGKAFLFDAGLGGRADNFETMALRVWPNPRSAAELWPDDDASDVDATRLATENAAYSGLADDECGRLQLAQRSVAVPFVGATATAISLAGVLRVLHTGAYVSDFKFRLSAPGERRGQLRPCIPSDVAHMEFTNRVLAGATSRDVRTNDDQSVAAGR